MREALNEDVLLSAWLVDRSPSDLRMLVAAAHGGKLPEAQLQLRPLASRDDSLTVQVVEGAVPAEPRARLYVLGRGIFGLARRERWPRGQELLLLEACPIRSR